MLRYKEYNDENIVCANIRKVYTIVGRTYSGYGVNRYIQCNWNEDSRPHVESWLSYSCGNVVVFTNRIQAENFLGNFLRSKTRRTQCSISWEIKEHKPSGYKAYDYEYRLIERYDDEYGYYYKLRLEKCERAKHEDEIETTIDNKCTLETKLVELDNLVLEVKNILKVKEDSISTQEAIEKVKDLIMKYDIRVGEVYEEYEILNYVQDNFYPEDIVEVDYRWR